jgi:hypothetical protein
MGRVDGEVENEAPGKEFPNESVRTTLEILRALGFNDLLGQLKQPSLRHPTVDYTPSQEPGLVALNSIEYKRN